MELVAKVSFNEGLDSYPDLALIYQIVEGHGDTALDRARWLEQHSRCASGVITQDRAYARPGICHWTRNLMPDGRRPRGFHDCHDVDRDGQHDEEHCDGRWSRIRDRWLAHLERVRAFVYGQDTYRPCSVTPQSWDGTRYGRDTVEGRGHTILECDVEYTSNVSETGLHNFAVTWRREVRLTRTE